MKKEKKVDKIPQHLKELRKIRLEMAKECKKDPEAFWKRIKEQGDEWRKEKAVKTA